MIHCDTILNAIYSEEKMRLLPIEKPVILQLGGSDPGNLAKAAKIGEANGYDEINLNCGCPSPRVTSGSFGACLMKEPKLVAECVKKMEEAVKIPVTVKCRLGVDDLDDYDFLKRFVEEIKNNTNCKHIIVHARKAFLKGLNPKQNRNIPPLIYERVYQVAQDYPDIKFSINGGIKTLEHAGQILKENPKLLGVMMGRAAYQSTWIFGDLDRKIYGVENPLNTRKDILRKYGEYADYTLATIKHFKIPTLVRPLLGLFARERGFKLYKRFLSEKKNYKDEKSFSSFMEKLIIFMEEFNSEALNQKYDEEGLLKMKQKQEQIEKIREERRKKKLEAEKQNGENDTNGVKDTFLNKKPSNDTENKVESDLKKVKTSPEIKKTVKEVEKVEA
jgi:tRNA-dihydrouridine synthase A